jgi:hypothetical protein
MPPPLTIELIGLSKHLVYITVIVDVFAVGPPLAEHRRFPLGSGYVGLMSDYDCDVANFSSVVAIDDYVAWHDVLHSDLAVII